MACVWLGDCRFILFSGDSNSFSLLLLLAAAPVEIGERGLVALVLSVLRIHVLIHDPCLGHNGRKLAD